MENDIEKYKTEFQKRIDDTISCTRRSVQENAKMPRKPSCDTNTECFLTTKAT